MYTLQDFVKELPMEGLKILANPSAFSDIIVSSLSVQERPLDTFVQKDEIILSTLIGCLDDDEIFKQFLKDVKASQAAALLVCFKDPSYRPSKNIIDCAIEIGLPLLCLPWEVRFADVIHFATRRIHDKNIESYKYTRDRLFSAYFSSQSLDDAARILSQFFGSHVAIAGKNLNIKGRSCSKTENDNCAVIDIRVHTILWGHLYICQPEKCTPLLEDDKLLEQYILLPLSLWFNKENIEDMIVLKMKNDFVWDLATKNYSSFSEMTMQGAKLGFNLSASHICFAFCVCANESEQVLDEYSPQAAKLSNFMEDVLIAERKRRKLNIMFADRGLQFIVFVEASKDSYSFIAEDFIASLNNAFVKDYPHLQLYWGISDMLPENSEKFHQISQNAQLALRYCLNNKDASHVFTYKDTQFQQVISELSRNEKINAVAGEVLDAMIEYDKNSSMELMNTLVEFIKNDGNTSQTARNMHLNRQSLLYRLKKIESLTGMSLNQRKDLFLLELFTRIHSYY